MLLKKIVINGFKSFANRTEFLIEPGITGIVGPNGSGKSNIADAIRWVLGEQSSKNLRGVKMEDVIFNGTQDRAKKAYCEVSLYFDNEDMRIKCDYSEIVITRRMYRSGESEYKINNTIVRLKDILDIIRDTGIGKEGYSIIGQGKIDEILASKPVARRKVFEEAAGVMKFRARKEEAERKLARTDENLVRIEDVVDELSNQLEPMREQAELTREYLALFDRLRFLDANIFLTHHERINEKEKKLKAELADIEKEIGSGIGDLEESAKKLAALNERLEELEAEAETISQKVAACTQEVERLKGEINLEEERKANAITEEARIKQELEAKESEIIRLSQERAAYEDKLAHIKNSSEAAEIDGILAALKEKQAAYAEKEEALKALRAEMENVRASIADLNQNIIESSADQAGATARREELFRRMEEAVEEQSAQYSLLLDEQEKLRELSGQRDMAVSEYNGVRSEILKQSQAIEKAQSDYNTAVEKRGALESRKKLLLELKADYEGYSDTVKSLMKEAKIRSDIKSRLIGTLAELMEVPRELETAIETLLGGALQNLVVQTEEDAKFVIEFLREKKLGRATFLPTAALRVETLKNDEKALLNSKGCIGVASELIKCSAEARAAVDFMLARTVVVDDLDNAIALVQKAGHTFRAVTLKGDVLRPGGSMSGGSTAKKQFGLLSQERAISDVDALIDEAYAAEERAEAILKKERAAAEECDNRARQAMDVIRTAEVAIAAQKQIIAGAEARREECANAAAEIEKLLADIKQTPQEELDALGEKRDKLNAELEAMNDGAEKAEAELAAMRAELEIMNDEMTRIKIAAAELARDLASVNENITRVDAEMLRIRGEKSDKQQLLFKMRAAAADREQRYSMMQEELERAEGALADANYADNKNAQERREQRELLQISQKDSTEFQVKRTTLLERKYKLENQLERGKLQLESFANRMWEEYSLTYAACEQYREKISYADSVKESNELRERIRQMGNINPNAITDFERVNERLAELAVQRDDLIKAEDDLRALIEELMGAMRVSFTEKFELIRENFRDIFSELFGGGQADIFFDEDDCLNCGIEIVAEPPGKKLQHIQLLSGGERALTAIALLFAMLRINPSPVCLLDEIDAPLDEENVIRFSNYLKNISTTQFLLITHKKYSMSICDVLYGIAMEEKGVSGLVSVRMADNERMA